MKLSNATTAIAALIDTALALSAAEWRSQSIYFLLTDRFGRADNSTTATCNTADRVSLVVKKYLFWVQLLTQGLDILRGQLPRDHQSCADAASHASVG